MNDEQIMAQALKLAEQGKYGCTPNPMVGCVIIKDNQVVGAGFHEKAGKNHAEINALKKAKDKAIGATMYVTLEPCSHTSKTPPCIDAIIKANIKKVFIAIEDPDQRVSGKGIKALTKAGIACQVGLKAKQAQHLLRGYLSRQTKGRPWLRLKTASTMDGRIALDSGISQWITCQCSRKQVHELRAQSCALLTGSGTALADDPSFDVRGIKTDRMPLRVLVDGRQRCHKPLKMLKEEGCLVAIGAKQKLEFDKHVQIAEFITADEKVDLKALLNFLAANYQTNIVQAEVGAGMAGVLIKEDLVDEIVAFIAPKFFGSGKNLANFQVISDIQDAPSYEIQDVVKLDTDVMITMLRK